MLFPSAAFSSGAPKSVVFTSLTLWPRVGRCAAIGVLGRRVFFIPLWQGMGAMYWPTTRFETTTKRGSIVDMRKTYLEMIRAFPGGWDAMAGALGMSRDALENRIYERKGQSVLLDTALQMQAFSGTTLLAEAVARQAGGVFMQLPEHGLHDREELLTKFNELHARLGDLSKDFSDFTRDNVIERHERRALEDVGQQIHRTVAELLALTFSIYCRRDGDTPARAGGCQ